MGIIGQYLERRATFGAGSDRIPNPTELGGGRRSFAGPHVSNDTALGLTDVYKAVSLISDSVAMLPARAFRNTARRNEAGMVTMHATKIPNQPACLIDPIPDDANPQFSFSHRVMDSLLLDGNAYCEVAAIDKATGTPTVIIPLHPSAIKKVERNSAGFVEYEMHDGGLMGHWRNGGTMLHWPGYVQAGAVKGISPIRANMQAIGLAMAAEEFGARTFGDGTHPMGVLETDKSDMTEDQAKRIQRRWVATAGGLNREPRVLYGGMKWRPIAIAPDEAQFIETRKMQAAQIAGGIYRIPGHMVGDSDRSTSWGTGIEEQGIGYVTYTLGPWLARFEEAMSWLLPRGQFVKKNVGALLRGRQGDRYAGYALGRQWGWLSVNDIRELEDLHPVDGGDVYLQPLNMVEASEALALMMANKSEPTPELEAGEPADDAA